MGRTIQRTTLAALVLGMACSGTAHAEGAVTPQSQVLLPTKGADSPYQVELIDGHGRQLPTYSRRGRFYVLGHSGSRYTLRVHNPTARRIEAVVSVDGLDVIDGQTANFQSKRGYVVAPHDSIEIEGFRTSSSNVATFRFSSVGNSYAGRKGQARNVGVIGVAIFEERGGAHIARPHHRPYPRHRRGRDLDYRDYLEGDGAAPQGKSRGRSSRQHARKRPAPPASDAPQGEAEAPRAGARRGGPTRSRIAPRHRPRPCHSCNDDASSRPGLGTEYGESRYSAVTWTRFVRKSSRPDAIATLRYNDVSGLAALGIYVPHGWETEIATRESANPFPGSFAAPPPY